MFGQDKYAHMMDVMLTAEEEVQRRLQDPTRVFFAPFTQACPGLSFVLCESYSFIIRPVFLILWQHIWITRAVGHSRLTLLPEINPLTVPPTTTAGGTGCCQILQGVPVHHPRAAGSDEGAR